VDRDKESKWKCSPERTDNFCHGPNTIKGRVCERPLMHLGSSSTVHGHAGLLTPSNGRRRGTQHPEEARILLWMAQPKICRISGENEENIQKKPWADAQGRQFAVERFRRGPRRRRI